MTKKTEMTQTLKQFAPVIVIILFIIASIWFLADRKIIFNDTEIRQSSLPDELRETAESIYETTPPDEPIQITTNVALSLDYWEIGSEPHGIYNRYVICIDGQIPEESNYRRRSRIWVNGQRVSGLGYAGSSLYGTPLNRCVQGDLEPGLHLVEFHLRDSAWGEPIAIHQWAIEIE